MSEEEIIRNVKRIIDYKVISNYINNSDSNYIQGLLDLYKEEKDKSKTLETLLQGTLYEMYLYYKELAGKYQANSISKDKIREKIKEYQNKLFQDIEENKVVEYENIIQVLEELLEE